MKTKVIRNIILAVMAVLILMMMAATVIQKALGDEAAFSYIYHSVVFVILWAVVAVLGAVYLVLRGVHKRLLILLLHVAFLFILAGALTTHLTSTKGTMYLRLDETASRYATSDGDILELPFALTLKDFSVENYPGTDTPMNYVSTVVADDQETTISMNRIMKRSGYRIFQSGYMEGGEGTILTITHDPWGTGITYVGYYLLFLSLIAFFLCKDTAWRKALRRITQAAAAFALVAALGLATAPTASASRNEAEPKAFPKEVAEDLGRLEVYYNGRICPLQTLARDYVMKVYGKPSVHGYTSEQVLSGWMFYYDTWKDLPVKVKAKDRGTSKETEKHYAISAIASGRALKMFPVKDSLGTITWFAPSDKLPGDMDPDEWIFVKKVVSMVGEDVFLGDYDSASKTLQKLHKWQQKELGDAIPSQGRHKAERLYNIIGLPKVPFMICITIGILLFILTALPVYRRISTHPAYKACVRIASLLVFAYLTLVIALRWYVSGHLPMASGHEMMMLIAWFSMLVTLVASFKLLLAVPLGFILTGFAMLVASLGEANPQITPLMPVLSSPLLSVHVSCMMISYTLFGLVALNGLMGLIARDPKDQQLRADTGLVVLYPATFLLTAGTFIGAIWANVSWGSYWAWDPKETWALITCLIYAAALHTQSIETLRKPRVFNTFCIAAFISVLITYFGVNFLLGGMHSYA